MERKSGKRVSGASQIGEEMWNWGGVLKELNWKRSSSPFCLQVARFPCPSSMGNRGFKVDKTKRREEKRREERIKHSVATQACPPYCFPL